MRMLTFIIFLFHLGLIHIVSNSRNASGSVRLSRMNSFSDTLSSDRLVCVVCLAVREEVVDNHADNREEENNEGPDDLARDGAVRLEDLDWRYMSAWTAVQKRSRQQGTYSTR
jgi:hypothetical protein